MAVKAEVTTAPAIELNYLNLELKRRVFRLMWMLKSSVCKKVRKLVLQADVKAGSDTIVMS